MTASVTIKIPTTPAELQITGQNLANAKVRDPFDGNALPGEIPGEGPSAWAEARWRF